MPYSRCVSLSLTLIGLLIKMGVDVRKSQPVGSPGDVLRSCSLPVYLGRGGTCTSFPRLGRGASMQIAKWIIAVVAAFDFGDLVADALVPVTAKQHLWIRAGLHMPNFITAKPCSWEFMRLNLVGHPVWFPAPYAPALPACGCNGGKLFCRNGSGPCVPRYRLDRFRVCD